MAEIVLNVEVRERAGSGASREVRRAGKVPGVLYGGKEGPISIAIKQGEFRAYYERMYGQRKVLGGVKP